jgi:hypothetical protein
MLLKFFLGACGLSCLLILGNALGADERPGDARDPDAVARLAGAVETLAQEVERLHEEVRVLRKENERLRGEMDKLRRSLPGSDRRGRRPAPRAEGRFRDHGDYVEDVRTGLLWQKDGDASGKLNFYQAKDYAEELELGGLSGWRVPTRKELEAIFPAVAPPFVDTKYTAAACCQGPYEWNSYWTSELDPRLPDYAYVYQWYAAGGANNCYASRNDEYVRCVHDPVTK